MKWIRLLLISTSTSIILIISFSFGHTDSLVMPASKSELGRMLFFERALSLDSSISCASCHIPEYAFSDTVNLSRGVHGQIGVRNTPSIMNITGSDLLFYDGRAGSLQDQVHFPIEEASEMNLDFNEVVNRLNRDEKYVKYFETQYNEKPNRTNIANAIAEFEKTLETSNTPFDDYMIGKNEALDSSAVRGRLLFLGDKAKCFDCHFGPDFTGNEFRNIGLFDGGLYKDKGRFEITGDSSDLGKFKVPGLRNVAVTGPYMHDGSFKSLREVIKYYNDPFKKVRNPQNMDTTLLKPLNLDEKEQADLVNFLRALTDRRFLIR